MFDMPKLESQSAWFVLPAFLFAAIFFAVQVLGGTLADHPGADRVHVASHER